MNKNLQQKKKKKLNKSEY